MKNFLRAMRFAWPYRYRITSSVVCAVLAAAFWGLNFTAIYPVLKIIGSDQNLQAWAKDSIEKLNKEIVPLQKSVDDLTKLEALVQQKPDEHDRNRALRQTAGELTK